MSRSDAWILEALNEMSTFRLFQMARYIDQLLKEPRRILEVRQDLQLGKRVRFLERADGEMQTGQVVGFRDSSVNIQVIGERFPRAVPLAAIEPDEQSESPIPSPPTKASKNTIGNRDKEPPPSKFFVGQRVMFSNDHGEPVVGIIDHFYGNRATVNLPSGEVWRVAFKLMQPVVDM